MPNFTNFKEHLQGFNFYSLLQTLTSFIRKTVLMNSYKATIKVSITYCIKNWILILVIIHLKMDYNNLIQIATTEMEDIWLREINELYPIDKQPNPRHKVQYDQDTLSFIHLSGLECKVT